MDAERCFNFNDFNLDFIDLTPPQQKTQQSGVQRTTCAELKASELAKRIADCDTLVAKVQQLDAEQAQLQQQLQDFRQTAKEIQTLYESEKQQRCTLQQQLLELQGKYDKLDDELAHKTLQHDQLQAQCDELQAQCDAAKGPLDYCELALKYLKLTQKLEESLHWTEKAVVSDLRKHCEEQGHTLLPLQKSPKKKGRASVSKSVQCVLLENQLPPPPPAVEDKSTQCDANLPKTTQCQSTQCDRIVTRSQSTQHISTTTTRSTSTACFIKKHNVGTSFPEPKSLPPLDDILAELRKWDDIAPLSPICELRTPTPPPVTQCTAIERRTIGTCTFLCNVQRQIDFIPSLQAIKRSHSRSPTRQLYENVACKREAFITPSPSPPPVTTTGPSTVNAQSNGAITNGGIFASSFPQLAQLQPTVFTAFWQMVGQILLSLLHPTAVRGVEASSGDSGNKPSTMPASVGLDLLKEQNLHNWMYSSCENIQQTLQRTREQQHNCAPSCFDPATTVIDGLGPKTQINFVGADNLGGNMSTIPVSKDPQFCMPPSKQSIGTGPLHLLTHTEQEAFCELEQEQATAYGPISGLPKFDDIGQAQQVGVEKSLKRKRKNKHKYKRRRDRETQHIENAGNFSNHDSEKCYAVDEMMTYVNDVVKRTNHETETESNQKQIYGNNNMIDATKAMPEIGCNEWLEQKKNIEYDDTVKVAEETTDGELAVEDSAVLASETSEYTELQKCLFGPISDTEDSEQSAAEVVQNVCDLNRNTQNKISAETNKIEPIVSTRVAEIQEAELLFENDMQIVKQPTMLNGAGLNSDSLKLVDNSASLKLVDNSANALITASSSNGIVGNQFRSPNKSVLSATASMPQLNEDAARGEKEVGMKECQVQPAHPESYEQDVCEQKVVVVTDCMQQSAEDEHSESNLIIDESIIDEANSPSENCMDILHTKSDVVDTQSVTTDCTENVKGDGTAPRSFATLSTTDVGSSSESDSSISPLMSNSLLQNIMANDSTCEVVNAMLQADQDDLLLRSPTQNDAVIPKRRGRKRKGEVLATPTVCKRSERLRSKQMRLQINTINIRAKKRSKNTNSPPKKEDVASVANCESETLSIEVSSGKDLAEPALSIAVVEKTSKAKCDTPDLYKNSSVNDELQQSSALCAVLEKAHIQPRFQCSVQQHQQRQTSTEIRNDSLDATIKPSQILASSSSLSAYEVVQKMPLPAATAISESDTWPSRASIAYDPPASPPPACVDSIPATPTKEIPLELYPAFYPRKHNSLLERLVAFYSADQYKIVNAQSNTGTLEQRRSLSDQLQLFLSTTHSNLDLAAATLVRALQTITNDNELIAAAIVTEVKAVPRPEIELACSVDKVPAKYLTAQLRQITVALRHLHYAHPGCTSALLAKIESTLFQYQNVDAVSVSTALNLTQLYLLAIPILYSSAQANPARLFIAKCLYYYNVRATPMVYEVLCCYPTALPHREDRSYDRSDALITVIQHTLMCTTYNMLSSDLRTKELLSMLRFQYHYQPYKPDATEVLANLLAKLKAGRLANLKYAFAIFCKRQPPAKVLAEVLQAQLMPLASEYYQQVLQTSDYDERVAALLDCISTVVKPLPIDTDVSVYLATFERFLSAVQRSAVQEAAVLAILRLQRFDYCSCFRAFRNFTPAYTLQPLTKNVLKTFIHRRPLKIWKQLLAETALS